MDLSFILFLGCTFSNFRRRAEDVRTMAPDQEEPDQCFKVLIVGNTNVGKTCFQFRFTDNTFSSNFVSTVGVDFKQHTLTCSGERVKLQIWDTAGQERYRSLCTAYFRGTSGFIVMYDVSNEASFNAVRDWMTQIKTLTDAPNVAVVLVGNKADLDDTRAVTQSRGANLGEELGLEFFETSVKDNFNVREVFEKLVETILEKKKKETMLLDPAVVLAQIQERKDTEEEKKDEGCPCTLL